MDGYNYGNKGKYICFCDQFSSKMIEQSYQDWIAQINVEQRENQNPEDNDQNHSSLDVNLFMVFLMI